MSGRDDGADRDLHEQQRAASCSARCAGGWCNRRAKHDGEHESAVARAEAFDRANGHARSVAELHGRAALLFGSEEEG